MPSSTTESHVDVLVIGAGPAGLMCTLALARAGVNVRVIDKRPMKVAAGQADGIQPRTIEVLQSYGLAETFLRQASRMNMAAFYNPGPDGGIQRTGRAPDVTAPTARYPFEGILHQGHIESMFIDALTKLGVTIDRPIKPTSLVISEDPAVLQDPTSYATQIVLEHLNDDNSANSTEVVHAKFVLGADGAHSWTRNALGFAMEGEDTEYVWGVLDFFPDTDFPDIRNRTAVHSVNGSCMVIPQEVDKIRLYLQLDPKTGVVDEQGRLIKSAVNYEKLLEVAKKSFHPYRMEAIGPPEWWSIYKIRQQVANHFSHHERVFIAGDACHTHSPKAGQGMNASMNDTHNLAWKITHVLRGWAKLSLLKTYEAERRKYAQDLIAFDQKFASLFSGKPKTELEADGVSHEEFLRVFQTFGGFTSGIDIHYQPSAIVHDANQAAVPGLTVGMRVIPQLVMRAADARPIEVQDLLVADTRFKILVFTGKPEAQLAAVQAAADALEQALDRVLPGVREKAVDIIAICIGSIHEMDYNVVPSLLRSHWTKVYVDDLDVTKTMGGKAYQTYGIGESGAIVVVRPDGYVGTVLPLADAGEVGSYFATFTSSS